MKAMRSAGTRGRSAGRRRRHQDAQHPPTIDRERSVSSATTSPWRTPRAASASDAAQRLRRARHNSAVRPTTRAPPPAAQRASTASKRDNTVAFAVSAARVEHWGWRCRPLPCRSRSSGRRGRLRSVEDLRQQFAPGPQHRGGGIAGHRRVAVHQPQFAARGDRADADQRLPSGNSGTTPSSSSPSHGDSATGSFGTPARPRPPAGSAGDITASCRHRQANRPGRGTDADVRQPRQSVERETPSRQRDGRRISAARALPAMASRPAENAPGPGSGRSDAFEQAGLAESENLRTRLRHLDCPGPAGRRQRRPRKPG